MPAPPARSAPAAHAWGPHSQPRPPQPGRPPGRGRRPGLRAGLGWSLGLGLALAAGGSPARAAAPATPATPATPAASAASAPSADPGREAARQLAGALLQVQGSQRDGQVLNDLRSSALLWPHADCPGRYVLTVRHGVNGATPRPGDEPLFSPADPSGARVALQAARREGQAPARGDATVIATGPAMGTAQDWALLRLDRALPQRALPPDWLAGGPPRPGQALRLLGLPADAAAPPGPEPRAVLEAPCRATEADADTGGWRSSCRGAAGQSGGPVLFGPLDGRAEAPAAGWRIGGLVITRREAPGAPRAVFLSLHALAPVLDAALARDRQRLDCRADTAPGSTP